MNQEQHDELRTLRILQADHSRWFSQEEFDRLKYLKSIQYMKEEEPIKPKSVSLLLKSKELSTEKELNKEFEEAKKEQMSPSLEELKEQISSAIEQLSNRHATEAILELFAGAKHSSYREEIILRRISDKLDIILARCKDLKEEDPQLHKYIGQMAAYNDCYNFIQSIKK